MPPTYSYAHKDPSDCQDFDIQQSIKDGPLTVCPKCSKPIKKVITSAPGFTMAGATPKFHG